MATNFRLLQEDPNSIVYISKTGLTPNADPNAGYYGSRNNPRPSVASYLAEVGGGTTGVVGTGSYAWSTHFANGTTGTDSHNLVADGYVRIQGDGHTRNAPFVNSGATFIDLLFEQFAGFSFRAYGYGNGVHYERCVFKVLPEFGADGNSSASGGIEFVDCVFENVHFISADSNSNSGMQFTRCLFFNCTNTNDFGRLTQCYLDATSALHTTAATGCNVDPGADPTAGYGLCLNGGPPVRTSPQGISAAPRFNALAYGDYSVQAGSPHLAAGIGPVQFRQGSTYLLQALGAGQPATPASATFAALGAAGPSVGVLATEGGLVGTAQPQAGGGSQPALVVVAGSGTSGRASLLTGAVQHSAGSPRELSRMQALGGYNFDTADPATEAELNPNSPEVYNNNVPTLSQHAPGAPGRNPHRLTYGLRWSVAPHPDPANPADWVHGDAFVEMEWNTQPLLNPATLLGNGHPDFDPALGRAVVCTWYQLRIGLSNTYYH